MASKPWTLGAIRAMNLQLEAACAEPGCGWSSAYDLDKMIAEFGADCELPTEAGGLACGRCGAPVDFGLVAVKKRA
ncbi:MAG: hypothetical protein JSR61_16535 [Proteobacteria bacterium]|nr:hypothetical protein [Pseudomonadota bacterium]